MGLATVLFFLVLVWCLGYTATSFVKNDSNSIERNVMRLGFGLAILALLLIILNIIRIPLLWWLVLLLSIAYPLYKFYKAITKKTITIPTFKLSKSNIYIIIVLVIFLFTFSMYTKGAFGYHWLEDGDPWIHASSVKYIAEEKTLFEPQPHEDVFQYLDPYPPAYGSILAMVYQFQGTDMIWILKFFNALFISLSIPFFYFFAKRFTGSGEKALWGTFILAAIPSFMSHFIWAHSLAIMFIFPILYAFEWIKVDARWKWIAGATFAAMLVTQPTQPLKFGVILGIYLLVHSIIIKRVWWQGFFAAIFAGILSLLWWARPLISRGGSQFKQTIEIGVSKWYEIKIPGSADRVYSFNDFFIAKGQNMINVPIGIGWVIMVLFIVTLFLILYYKFKQTKALMAQHKSIAITLYILEAITFITLVLGFFSPLNIIDKNPMGFSTQLIFAIISFLLLAVISLLLILYKQTTPTKSWVVVPLFALAFTFLGVHGATLFFQLFAFRFWILFSIFVALLVPEGIVLLKRLLSKQKTFVYFLLFLFVIGIFFTSMSPKQEVNSATWGASGSIMQYGQLDSWKWFDENVPDNTNTYYACDTRFGDFAIISYDKNTCYWCKEIRESKKWILNQSTDETYQWLKNKQYEYMIVDGNCVKTLGENETNQRLQLLSASPDFAQVHQGQGMVIFRLR